MKLFILGIVVFLVQSSHQLPVKESTTQKDPNAHKDDSEQHNLENIIGEISQVFILSSVFSKFRLFLAKSTNVISRKL